MLNCSLKQDYTELSEIDYALVRESAKAKEKRYAYQLENRLREWAKWLSKEYDSGTGYPAKSITMSALEGSRSTVKTNSPDHPGAEEVNKAFLLLRKRHYANSLVLQIEYVVSKLEHGQYAINSSAERQKKKAEKLGISLTVYKSCLKEAKSFIEARIAY